MSDERVAALIAVVERAVATEAELVRAVAVGALPADVLIQWRESYAGRVLALLAQIAERTARIVQEAADDA